MALPINIETLPSPPTDVFIDLVDMMSRQITFTWSPSSHQCPDAYYNLLTSNCGSCPTTTNYTNVTNGSVCAFIVQTLVCDDILGHLPDGISGKMLKCTAAQIAPSVTGLFNLSLIQLGKFPDIWKTSFVIICYISIFSLCLCCWLTDKYSCFNDHDIS